MTNSTLPDPGAGLSPELMALAPVGGKRRPVKIVEHPAFRPHRSRAAVRAPSLRVPVVSLNRAARAVACPCCGAGSTIATTSQEAA